MNKKLLLTACMRNSGFSTKSTVSAFNNSKCQTENEVLFNPLLLIHAKYYGQVKRGIPKIPKTSNLKIYSNKFKQYEINKF